MPVIGNGVVIDLGVLFQEIDGLDARGVDTSKLLVSANAHIIPSYNRTLDKVTERFLGSRRIGTTGRGIGPTYADKMSRVGIRVQDIFDEKILRQKVEGALEQKNHLLVKVYNRRAIEVDEVVDELLAHADRLRPMVTDTSLVLGEALARDEVVLLEGGQATLLDVDHGTYPFVTSSNATGGGARHRRRASRRVRSRASSGSPRPTSRASARARSRPSCSTTTARSCARSATSSAPRPDVRGAAAGTTSPSPATPRASTASPTSC